MDVVKQDLDHHIIIGGLPRSGTSFVRGLVGSHSEISIYKWELPFWTQIYNRYGGGKLSDKKLTDLLEELFSSYAIVKSDIPFDKTEIKKTVDRSGKATSFDVYTCLLSMYRSVKGKKWIGVKAPYQEYRAEEIFQHFPETKFIHVIRNPINVSRSLKQARESWLDGRMIYFKHIYEWQKSVRLAEKNRDRYSERYFVLQYEHLVENTEGITKQVCDFLGIPFEMSMLKMEGQPGWKGSNSSFEGKDSPKNKFIMSRHYYILIGDLMKEWGYPVEKISYGVGAHILRVRYNVWVSGFRFYSALIVMLKRMGFRKPFRS